MANAIGQGREKEFEQRRKAAERVPEQRVLRRSEGERTPEVEADKETLAEKASAEERKKIETEIRRRTAPAPAARGSDPVTREIEDILSADLAPLYRTMTSAEQQNFRQHGETTARAIRRMMEEVKVKAKSILDLIRQWLKLIPGVNQFFLEQEAKIKTDKVLALRDRIRGRE